MEELKKAEERISAYQAPFDEDSPAAAKANVMARTIDLDLSAETEYRFPFKRVLAVAAGLALILSIPFAVHFVGNTTIMGVDSTSSHALPDGSSVLLAQGSSVTYNSLIWNVYKTATLDGEAYFEVEKGGRFVVETSHGRVSVLGTKFSVWENNDALAVHCREGKVDAEGEILTEGQYVVISPESTERGDWENREPFISRTDNGLSFENAPIRIVIESLEAHFDKEILFRSEGVLRFSGNLDENDFQSSLEILTKPFGLKVTTKDGRVVTLEP